MRGAGTAIAPTATLRLATFAGHEDVHDTRNAQGRRGGAGLPRGSVIGADAGDYITKAYGDFLESPDLVLVCGGGGSALEAIRQMTPPDVAISTMPQHIGGFTRSSASA